MGAFAATSNTGELSGMYHALDWIITRRTSSSPVVRPRYKIVSDSDYCVKLFATRSIKPEANNRMIARIYALLALVKLTKDVSISWTPSPTKADTPLAKGDAAADLLAARGCGASCLLRSSNTGLPSPALRPRSSKPRPPPCCVALEASGGLPVKTPAYPRLTGDNPPSGVRSFCD